MAYVFQNVHNSNDVLGRSRAGKTNRTRRRLRHDPTPPQSPCCNSKLDRGSSISHLEVCCRCYRGVGVGFSRDCMCD